jgi:hypothetical protein
MYAPHELEFIVANLEECYDQIDKMIVCEFNINHTGVKREYGFLDLKDRIPEHLRDKLDYHACDIYDVTARAYEDEDAIHRVNEPVMRSWFTKLYDFRDDDIIISIDADEIIDRRKLPYIIDQVNHNGIVRLKMRQFFYKKTYLWKNKDFISAIATKYGSIQPKYPNNWREQGKVTDEYVGCHFSWCMDVDAMLHKLETYGHPQYRFCANRDLLEDAIENKKYPFDPNTDFQIEEISEDSEILPKTMRENKK